MHWTAIKLNQNSIQLTKKNGEEGIKSFQDFWFQSDLVSSWPSTAHTARGRGKDDSMNHHVGSQVSSHLDLWMSYSLLTLNRVSNQKDSKQVSAISLGHRKLDKEDNLWNPPLVIDLWEISPRSHWQQRKCLPRSKQL